MSKFQYASQALVNVLEKNGFVDITAKYDKKHADRLAEAGGKYEPNVMKRYFAIPRKNGFKFMFDYINIYLVNSSGRMLSFNGMSPSELKSAIAFCQLSGVDQDTIRSRRQIKSPTDLAGVIKDVSEAIANGAKPGQWVNIASYRRLLEKYEEVKL